MDNKQEITMIRCLIANYGSYLDDKTAGYNNHDLCKALMKAIKSLEAWDKINEELEKEMNEYENVLSDLSYSDGLGYALATIEEHLKEIEK